MKIKSLLWTSHCVPRKTFFHEWQAQCGLTSTDWWKDVLRTVSSTFPYQVLDLFKASDLLMRSRLIFWSSASGAPRRPTFVARQTPSAADGSLGVKMLDGRVLGLSPHGLFYSTVLLDVFLWTAIYVVYHSTDSASQQFLEHISTCNVYS